MSPRSLQVGLLMPHIEGMYEGRMARWGDLVDFARAAEDLGFDSLWFGDHLLYRFPDIATLGTWEAWSMMAATAQATERIQIGTMVTVTPWRGPGLLAKIVDTVDEISEGRVILGVGAGSHEAEFPAFGFHSWSERIDRFTEEVEVVRTLLRTGRVDHRGRYHELHDTELRPRGPRSEGPPIMVGAVGPHMLRVTARVADDWNIPWCHDIDELQRRMREMDDICSEVGRDPETLTRSVCLQVDLPNYADYPSTELLRRSRVDAIAGSQAEIADRLRAYAQAGISHIQLYIDPTNVAGIEACSRVLAELEVEGTNS